MRKLSCILSCIVISLILSSSQTFAIDSTNSADPRYMNKMDKLQAQNTLRETKTATRQAIMEDKMASKAARMSKREEFKTKLQEITDSRKQAIVEKIDTRLTTMNTTQTSKWMEALTKMESIVTRISSQGSNLKAQGEDTTALEAAIASAQTAITAAKTAVNTQASKEYVITINSESTLRANVGSTVSQFRTDSRTTRQTVIAARAAVVKAFVELTKLAGETIDGNASNSGIMRVQ